MATLQKPNPSDQDYRDKFDNPDARPGTSDVDDLEDNYKNNTADAGWDDPATAKSRHQQSDTDALRNSEANGDKGPWVNSVIGTPGKKTTKVAFKKTGPIGALIALLFGGAFGVTAIFSGPSLLLVHIYEEVTGDPRVNTQLTSMQVRTNLILNSKFGNATKGLCTGTKITLLCKYSRPSNYLLKQMEANGVTPMIKDADGKLVPMTSNGLWPNSRPDALQFTDSTGKLQSVDANSFARMASSDTEFGAALNKAYNPRFVSLMDHVFSGIKARFGFTGTDNLNKETDPTKVTQDVEKSSAGKDLGASAGEATTAEGEAAADGVLRKLLGNELTDMLNKIGEAGKSGDLVGMVGGAVCAASDVPQMIIKVVRAYQMTQLVLYSVSFLKVAGAIKAGDATPTEVSSLGGDLTGVVGGLSAMDSFGMRNLLMGDSGVGKDKTWQKYSPGASVISALGSTASFLSSPAKQYACNGVTSPVTGLGINIAAADTGVGALPAALNFVGGIAVGTVITTFAPYIVDFTMSLIPKEVFSGVMSTLVGDLTSGLSGASVGDALASGSEQLMSQTANAGGNMPLKTEQAVAYNQVTQQVSLAYAQYDRATYSPLDASNPNTALGSFVNQFLPYYADMSSVSGVLSMIGSVVSSSLGSIINPVVTKAADPAYNYNQCQDPAIQQSDTAATPFCAIDYGIPTKYLNIDPTQVAQDLINSHDIDPTTGAPVVDNPLSTAAINTVFGQNPNDTSTLNSWMNSCTDGSTGAITVNDNACMITDQKTAEYALYTIDHRVQQTMDGEDSTLTNGSIDNSGDSTSTTTSAYQPNNNLSQYVALLNQFNQPVSTPTTPKATTQLATTTSASSFAAQFLTNLPTKRVSGVLA